MALDRDLTSRDSRLVLLRSGCSPLTVPASLMQWWNVAAPGTPMNEMKAATRIGNYAVRGSPCSATLLASMDAAPDDTCPADACMFMRLGPNAECAV